MYTLYIDTHYIKMQLVLFRDGVVLDERIKEDGFHTNYLISLLEDLMVQNHITFEDLSGIIVVNGPGSFTGVRIGVVVAKMIGYCQNIPIKVISYLQAIALKYDKECKVGLKDRNGVFVGKFDKNHDLVGDYYYLKNQDYYQCEEDIIIDEEINLDMVYEYLKDKQDIHPHFVKPIYVKKIEVDHG